MTVSQRLAGNAIWNVAPFAWSLVLALGSTAYFVRALGLELFGAFALLTVIAAPLSLVLLSAPVALMTLLPKALADGDEEGAAAFAGTTLRFAFVSTASSAAVLALFGTALVERWFALPVDGSTLQVCIWLTAATAFAQQLGSVLSALPAALSRFRDVAIGTVAAQTTTTALQVLLVMNGGGLLGLVAGGAAGALIALVTWVLLLRRSGLRIRGWSAFAWRSLRSFGGWQTVGQAGGLLATHSERIVLGLFLPPAALGIYNTVLRLQQAAAGALYRLTEVLLPFFSAESTASVDRRRELLLRASWVVGAVSAAAFSPMLAFPGDLLIAWVGSQVADDGATVLATMAAGGTIGAATSALHFYLYSERRSRFTSLLAIAYGIATCCIAALIVPRWGLSVAALAGVAALVVRPVAFHWVFARMPEPRVGLVDQVENIYLPAFVGIALSLACGHVLPPSSSIVELAARCVVIPVLCFVAIVLVGLAMPSRAWRQRDLKSLLRVAQSLARRA